MLQTIPDPFDSYGPPPAEDQIFTILPPLSVIANPSSAPSPLSASTPELESSDGLPSSKNSWSSTGGFFPDTAAAWADVPSSPPHGSNPGSGATSPSRSASPPAAVRATALSKRHSHPAPSSSFTHQSRKSESKLRSVLAVLDEEAASTRGRQGANGTNPGDSGHPRSVSAVETGANGKAPDLGESGADIWASKLPTVPGESGGGMEDTTPRNTMRARTPTPGIPSFESPFPERSRSPQSDDTAIPSPVASP